MFGLARLTVCSKSYTPGVLLKASRAFSFTSCSDLWCSSPVWKAETTLHCRAAGTPALHLNYAWAAAVIIWPVKWHFICIQRPILSWLWWLPSLCLGLSNPSSLYRLLKGWIDYLGLICGSARLEPWRTCTLWGFSSYISCPAKQKPHTYSLPNNTSACGERVWIGVSTTCRLDLWFELHDKWTESEFWLHNFLGCEFFFKNFVLGYTCTDNEVCHLFITGTSVVK